MSEGERGEQVGEVHAHATRSASGVTSCMYCGYSLAGISAERCPECGVEKPWFRLESGVFRWACMINGGVVSLIYFIAFLGLWDSWRRLAWYHCALTRARWDFVMYAGFWLAYGVGLAAYAIMHAPRPRPVLMRERRMRDVANLAPWVAVLILAIK